MTPKNSPCLLLLNYFNLHRRIAVWDFVEKKNNPKFVLFEFDSKMMIIRNIKIINRKR